MQQRMSCERCRQSWMLLFDEGGEAPEWIEAHLRGCAGCREFTRASERARREIRRLSLPRPDPAADRALLAALRSAPETEGGGWLGLGRVFGRLSRFPGWRPALPLAAAGLGSFVVTLLAAGWLSAMPGEKAEPEAFTAAGAAETRRVSADLQSRLDAWLALPAPTALPLRPLEPPAPSPEPQTVPDEPWKRSQSAAVRTVA